MNDKKVGLLVKLFYWEFFLLNRHTVKLLRESVSLGLPCEHPGKIFFIAVADRDLFIPNADDPAFCTFYLVKCHHIASVYPDKITGR